MAESEFCRVSPAAGVDQIGGAQDRHWIAEGENVRHDNARLAPLHLRGFGERDPAAEPPPASPVEPPTEAALRARLAECLERTKAALEALERAQQGSLRARIHRDACAAELAAFSGLEEEINAATLAALRGSDGRPDLTSFNDRIAARTVAELALTAADAALVELLHEHQQVTARWQSAMNQERLAVGRVIECGRAALREQMAPLRSKLAALTQLHGRGDDAEPWAAVAQALRADPLNAPLDVAVPDAPEPEVPPMQSAFGVIPATIRLARPVGYEGPDIEIPESEFHRQRARELRGEREPDAITELRAVERSRKGVGQ